MDSFKRVAAVVGTYKPPVRLQHCLASVLPLLRRPEDLIFVDNGSREAIGIGIAADFPGITMIRLDDNRFYCGGYNAGIQTAIDR